ncbi:hypothetical protein N7530_006658 [Penicillium desertorum]|uniref:Uncharacterized protein n=1 Tax=Penicillium desertorum TaxID=1303715 RepID=A0A9X0BMU0_9EURO|nr:hypothetical protein N7530_006658 [Penicillium desertorum]
MGLVFYGSGAFLKIPIAYSKTLVLITDNLKVVVPIHCVSSRHPNRFFKVHGIILPVGSTTLGPNHELHTSWTTIRTEV